MDTLRSSISKELKQKTIKRGAPFALCGASLLLVAAFLPLSFLKSFGFALFAISCILIAIGLVNYRRLLYLELNYFELQVGEHHMTFCQKGRSIFTVEHTSIQKLEFKQTQAHYGIEVWLLPPIQNSVRVHIPKRKFRLFLSKWKYESDLFLPFFTEKSLQELKKFV